MKKIALLSCTPNGGKTYLDYLKNVLTYLLEIYNNTPPQQKLCQIDFFQLNGEMMDVGLTISETENYLQYKVKAINNQTDFFKLFNYDVVFFNQPFLIPYFPDKVFCVNILHGNALMPSQPKENYFSWLAYQDAFICPSDSVLKACYDELTVCRKKHNNKFENLVYNQKRSHIRKTFVAKTQPIKQENFFNINDYKNVDKDNLTIAIFPTAPQIIGNDVSLFNSFNLIIESIAKNFPTTKIIFRSHAINFYKNDNGEYISHINGLAKAVQKLEQIIPNFYVDTFKKSSSEFFNQCDILITDGSSGGVSFLLNKAMPPIYYIPRNVVKTKINVHNFVALQKDKVLFAHSIKELIKQINHCINLTKEQRINYFNNYCENDLFLEVDTKQVLKNIIENNIKNFPYIDEKGNVFDF